MGGAKFMKSKKATIEHNGGIIHDGCAHPLGVVSYSRSFKGEMILSELKEHLFGNRLFPDAMM